MTRGTVAITALSLCFVLILQPARALAQSPIPSFPGAEGFGAQAVGGRGGAVIPVTNLNDTGPGSLRACVTAAGPRTCIFRVAGTIVLNSSLDVRNPYLTIAGQSAPGGGITLRTGPTNDKGLFVIRDTAHDVIVRYIRSRPGPGGSNGDTLDAITINSNNVMLDHVSASWGVDENMNTWYPTAQNISVQWSIISEGLSNSIHPQGEHSKGYLMGEFTKNISAHHILFAHNMDRHPEMKGDPAGVLEAINNVVYNWGWRSLLVSDANGVARVNIIGNYFKSGPNDPGNRSEIEYYNALGQGVRLYVKGNIGPHRSSDTNTSFSRSGGGEWSVVSSGTPDGYLTTSPFSGAVFPVTITSAQAAYDAVLAQAGSGKRIDCQGQWIDNRDSVDERIVSDVRNTSGHIIDHPDQVGGWPVLAAGTACADSDNDGMSDTWEQQWFGTPSRGSGAASSSDADSDGYTDLEEFLNGTAPLPAGTPTTGPSATVTPASATPTSQVQVTPTPPVLCTGAGLKQLSCFSLWRAEYYGEQQTTFADFTQDGQVSLADFEVWRRAYSALTTP